jgi:hypothetical protein
MIKMIGETSFVLIEVLYVVNGLVRNDQLLLANQPFEWLWINKQIKQTNMSQYKI